MPHHGALSLQRPIADVSRLLIAPQKVEMKRMEAELAHIFMTTSPLGCAGRIPSGNTEIRRRRIATSHHLLSRVD